MVVKTLVRPGEYRDSVALMLIARDLGTLAGVVEVSVVMGTPANQAVLRQAGLLTEDAGASMPNDLLVVVKAATDAAAEAALEQVQALLARRPTVIGGTSGGAAPARSVRGAVRSAPAANIAVISVPGQYAAAPAWDALRAGLHVFLFSDHVPLGDEIALKQYAREHSLFVMGPGAGTAIIDGVGLGFANAVPRGDIGIVAASGTGLQAVSSLIAQAGAGITQGIGVGGRDVSDKVGGTMLLAALETLQADQDTQVIVVVSKVPAASVVERLLTQIDRSHKPTVLALMTDGISRAFDRLAYMPHVQTTMDLRQAAAVAVALARGQSPETARLQLAAEDKAIERQARSLRRKLNPRQKYLRGLYSGGTLAEETLRIWKARLGSIWSNTPEDPRYALPNSQHSRRHTVVDMGEEEFTIGRPHPMLDSSLRAKRIIQEARDASVAAILLDVVIGYGAQPDPAAELAPAIAEAKRMAAKRKRELFMLASVIGTEGDPQALSRQTACLKQAGVRVFRSNTAAARFARALVG